MGKSSSLSEYWQLLELAEDYLQDGSRRAHAPLILPREQAASPAFPAAPAAPEPPPPAAQDQAHSSPGLAEIAAQVTSCTRCALHRARKHAVPGEGAAHPLVLVIGEGPGAEEDATGALRPGRPAPG
jgi:DNA polymerase